MSVDQNSDEKGGWFSRTGPPVNVPLFLLRNAAIGLVFGGICYLAGFLVFDVVIPLWAESKGAHNPDFKGPQIGRWWLWNWFAISGFFSASLLGWKKWGGCPANCGCLPRLSVALASTAGLLYVNYLLINAYAELDVGPAFGIAAFPLGVLGSAMLWLKIQEWF